MVSVCQMQRDFSNDTFIAEMRVVVCCSIEAEALESKVFSAFHNHVMSTTRRPYAAVLEWTGSKLHRPRCTLSSCSSESKKTLRSVVSYFPEVNSKPSSERYKHKRAGCWLLSFHAFFCVDDSESISCSLSLKFWYSDLVHLKSDSLRSVKGNREVVCMPVHQDFVI